MTTKSKKASSTETAETGPTLDTVALQQTAREVTDLSGKAGFADLMARLQTESGLMFGRHRGRVKAKMLGVDATGSDKDEALRNWANAARRALLKEGGAA